VTSSSPYDEKMRIHALADPARIFSARQTITRAVLEALQVTASDRHGVTLSESSGWLDYAAEGELWDRVAPPALPDKAAALKAAEGAIRQIDKACSAMNPQWPQSLQEVALLPPVGLLRRAELVAVPRPNGSAWDHWLYRAEPQLLLDGGAIRRAGVYGAQLEVRIGHLGQVIGVRSRWRPLAGERLMAEPSEFVEQEEGGSGDDEHEQKQPPIVNFLLEGDGLPQHYLAPYYFQTDGHDIVMSSASNWSLTLDIGRTRQDEERMTLTALAQGGSGDYLYNWAIYSLADFDEGFRELGGGRVEAVQSRDGKAAASSIDVDNGHGIVMVNVRDRATGAFKHFQQQIYSSAFVSPAAAPALVS
jgi:hypothetical protein